MSIQVYTNSYKIDRIPTAVYYHFDVDISPQSLTKGRNYEIIARLQTDNAGIFGPRPVYDGRKSMYSKHDIQSGEYAVFMGRNKTTPTHHVKIKRVSTINSELVMRLTTRRRSGDPNDLNSLQLLQLIVRQAPNLRHGFPADARSFYVAENSRDLRVGLSACRGFFQSVRPTFRQLIVNIDVSHAVVYTPGPLIGTMMQYLGLRNARDLQDLPPQKYAQLRVFLKGVRVAVNVSRSTSKRPISDLVREAGTHVFDRDGERLTVAAHFEGKYNRRVQYPRIVGVRIGKTAIIPAEFCDVIPGQVYRKKIPPQVQKDFLSFATQKPDQRFADIKGAVRGGLFDYDNSDFMKDAGMIIGTQPMMITGEVIQAPTIMYGERRGLEIQHKAGAWNLVGRKFLRPGKLSSWAVVVFDNTANPQHVQNFVTALVGNLQKLGMEVVMREPPIFPGNISNPELTLNEASMGRPGPELILVFLPANAADCRRAVKHWGDIIKNVSTQCVRGGKWEKNSDQYRNNVALKINSRCGGANSTIESPVNSFLKGSMVIGTDVGHPGPGVPNRPSITGLVASVDDEVSTLFSTANVQEPRMEIIQDLQDMVAQALNGWRKWRMRALRMQNPPPPLNIFFFRDGVSEGEFEQVHKEEIPMIKRAFAQVGMPEKYWPKLLFIVTGKRHHVRFFPRSAQEADRSGNCPAGLLVDKEITNPNYPDFYLQSHSGLLGTSRPSHYVILENEAGLDVKMIQTLTFHLCHTYASATRSVSIPAPVYYADKICSRLEFHCADGASLSDTASNVTGETQVFNLQEWKHKFKQSGLNTRMYYL